MGTRTTAVFYLRGGETRPPRKSSDVKSHIIASAWVSVKVPFISIWSMVSPAGNLVDNIKIANSVPDKIALLEQHSPEESLLLVPWPGRNTTDTIVVDDVQRILSILDRHEE
jgi:hypothetical protein